MDRDELRDLTRQRRTLLHQLTEHAAGTTERPDGARSVHRRHARHCVARRAPARATCSRGRLTQELSPAARFVADDDAPSPPARRIDVAAHYARRLRRATSWPARRARAELESARERAEEAEESVREHSEAATEATERLEAAHRHIADLEADLADARAELADLKRTERDAQRAERRARTEQERITSALHAAERAVADST